MTRDDVVAAGLELPAATLEWPFGDDVRIVALAGRIVLLVPEKRRPSFNAKCDPDLALLLRRLYPGIGGGWHQNKRHWNTVSLDGSVPEPLVRWLIGHSWEMVARTFARRRRTELGLPDRIVATDPPL
jgi:predicted DNA-binding protein (MmcQ/YjbR family)